MENSSFYTSVDFIAAAKKKLPKFVFDFIDGGAGNENALRENVSEFGKIKLIPRVRNKPNTFSLSTKILGATYSAPFGVAPLGLCGLVHPEADIILAKTAAKYNVPYVISAASSQSVDVLSRAAGTPPWFQLYIPKAQLQLDNLLKKAESNNCPVLVVTVDTSVPGRRFRDLRNGLKLPYKLNRSNVIEAIKCPQWTINRLLAGKLTFPNFNDAINENPNLTFSELMSLQTGGCLDWDLISKIRQTWKNKLVLKGVLSVSDAIFAQKMGVDAVIISNHGGRQLSVAPAPILLVPDFAKENLKKDFLLLDSGVRNGDDIAVGLASGAGFVFMGRAFLYALGAKGEEGVDNLFRIILGELSVNLQLLGVNSPDELNINYRYQK